MNIAVLSPESIFPNGLTSNNSDRAAIVLIDSELRDLLSRIGLYLLGDPENGRKPYPFAIESLESSMLAESRNGAADLVTLSGVVIKNGIVEVPTRVGRKGSKFYLSNKGNTFMSGMPGVDVDGSSKYYIKFYSPSGTKMPVAIAPGITYTTDSYLEKVNGEGGSTRSDLKVRVKSALSLSTFSGMVREDMLSSVVELARQLTDMGIKKVLVINATEKGGGVAEMMPDIVALFREQGIEIEWLVIEGHKDFFGVTVHIHEGLQNFAKPDLTQEEIDIYHFTNIGNFERLERDGYLTDVDFFFIEDPQVAGLIPLIRLFYPDIRIAWRNHIASAKPNPGIAAFISDLVSGNPVIDPDGRDRVMVNYIKERLEKGGMALFIPELNGGAHYAMYHTDEFANGLGAEKEGVPSYLMPPSINPFSHKNMVVPDAFISSTMEKYGLSTDKFTIVEISRFDPFKGPLEGIQAFARFILDNPDLSEDVQFVYAGNQAADNLKGLADYGKVKAYLEYLERKFPIVKGKIHILGLIDKSKVEDVDEYVEFSEAQRQGLLENGLFSQDAINGLSGKEINALEVNALQRQFSDRAPRKVALQASSREGFGLVVAEAHVKGTLTIASLVGGIRSQLENVVKDAPWAGIEYPDHEIDKSLELYEMLDEDQSSGALFNDEYFYKNGVFDNLEMRAFVSSLAGSFKIAYNTAKSDREKFQRLGMEARQDVLNRFTTLASVINRLTVMKKVEDGLFSTQISLYFNNTRAKFISIYEFLSGLLSRGNGGSTGRNGRVKREETTYSIKRKLEALRNDVYGLNANTSGSILDMVEAEMARFEADGLMDSLIILARKAEKENTNIILAIENDWIPGYAEGTLHHNVLSRLVKEIDNLDSRLKAMGINNVIIVRKEGGDFVDDILAKSAETDTDLSNVIVLASEKTVLSDKVGRALKGKAFLAGIDPAHINKFYNEYQENPDKMPYIDIIGMLLLAIEISRGMSPDGIDIIKGEFDPDDKIVIFLPLVRSFEIEDLRSEYDLMISALNRRA